MFDIKLLLTQCYFQTLLLLYIDHTQNWREGLFENRLIYED